MDIFGSKNIFEITLIEPSELALKRAALHLKKYNQQISLKTICKKFDALAHSDIVLNTNNNTIHLFSNILDIDDYSQNQLIELIEKTQSGINFFVCVSPYIDEIKTEKLEAFKRHFETNYDSFELLLSINNSKHSDDDFWCCNNTHKYNIVSHGNFFNCNEFTEKGCNNKWTRLINVFKVGF